MDRIDRQTALRRTGEMAAIFMIGDGVLGIVGPRRHVALWRSRRPAVDVMVRAFDGAPGQRRAYGVVQVAAGLALAAWLLKPVARD